MKFSISQDSRVGRRKNNQDRIAYSYSREALLMLVADQKVRAHRLPALRDLLRQAAG